MNTISTKYLCYMISENSFIERIYEAPLALHHRSQKADSISEDVSAGRPLIATLRLF